MIPIRLLNIGMRGATLLLKFALLFLLARLLEPEQVGMYGLLAAAVLYTAGVAGLGYSMYATREVAAAEIDERTRIIRDQAVFCAIAYVLILPLSLLLFVSETLPWTLAGWFFALMVLEHFGIEVERILVAASRQTSASVVLFLRNGGWVLAAVPLMWANPALRSLETVLIAWATGAAIACAVGLVGIARIGSWDIHREVDWTAMKCGLRVGLPLLVGTLALKGLTTFDRVWVSAIGGLEVLAPYVLFIGIANVLKAFLNSSVFPFSYPGLVRSVAVGDRSGFNAGMRSMILQTIAVTASVVVLSLLLIRPLLGWIDRPIYGEHIGLFYWAQLAVVLYAAGQAAQCGIYALRMDRLIISGQVGGLAVFIAAAAMFTKLAGVAGVLIALCIAYASMLLINCAGFSRLPDLVASRQ
jgi:O-antigen/teichoic acid export membrane protein